MPELIYSITKSSTFEAAHHLEGLPKTHKCARPHGHSYRVEVTIAAKAPDEIGFVVDFGHFAEWFKWLDDTFDHKDLNEVVDFNPTAEFLARYFFESLAQFLLKIEITPDDAWVQKVTVWETRKCSASVEVVR